MNDTLDLQSLVQAAGDAIIAAGTDGKILLWNPAAERIFGFTAEEALGHSLDLIIPERFRNRHWEGYQRVMLTGQTRYGTEVLRVPARRKDGRSLSIAFTVALLRSGDGGIQAIAAIVRDETARWEEERALRRRLTELEARTR
ncbi:MAG: PAS domain S-box protein [Candidatus Binatia bacterium]